MYNRIYFTGWGSEEKSLVDKIEKKTSTLLYSSVSALKYRCGLNKTNL